jgi:spoIIIJ-associated protein
MSEINETLRGIADAVLTGFGLTGDVRVEQSDDETIEVVVAGEGLDGLIGRDGQVIDALQYLMNQAAARAGGPERGPRVALDIGGYRERRQRQLERLAIHAADEAVRYGEEIELDAMTPHDRRIVHMALADRTDIVTRSEGQEPNRRIVVEPAPGE